MPQSPQEQATVALPNKLSKTKFHEVTGHTGLKYLPSAALSMNIQLTGSLSKCVHCALEKMQQANIPKEISNKAANPGERMYSDILSMRHPSFGKCLHWVLIVDEATHYKRFFFVHCKNDQIEPILGWIKQLFNQQKIKVKNIHFDNAGENQALEKEADKAGYGTTFEYTAPGTPQQNGVVERAFLTLLGRGRSMMNPAGFSPWLHKPLG